MDFHFADRSNRTPQSGIREIFALAQEYDDVADLSIGEPDFATPEPIVDAVATAIQGGAGSYTQTIGRADLRAAISDKLAGKNGISADPDSNIMVTPGAMGALYVATQVLCDDGDEVLVPTPYWSNYAGHIAAAGGDLVPVRTTADERFVPQPETVRDQLTDDTVGLLLNTPNNPTGAVVPPETLREIDDVLAENDCWVILDETYEDLVYDDATHHSLASDPDRFERIVTVHSFSKSYAMTGWRLGYVSGPAEVVTRMRILQEHTVSCATEPSQVAAAAALANPQVVETIHEAFAGRRDLILERLRDIPGVDPGNPQGAFYVFVDISALTDDSRAFVEYLLDEVQMAAVPGSMFGEGGEGHLRFSYANDADTIAPAMNRFETAVRRWDET